MFVLAVITASAAPQISQANVYVRPFSITIQQDALNYAKNNIDGLNISTRNQTTKAYHFFARMDGTDRAPEIEGVDQAWMRRVQALLSKYK